MVAKVIKLFRVQLPRRQKRPPYRHLTRGIQSLIENKMSPDCDARFRTSDHAEDEIVKEQLRHRVSFLL